MSVVYFDQRTGAKQALIKGQTYPTTTGFQFLFTVESYRDKTCSVIFEVYFHKVRSRLERYLNTYSHQLANVKGKNCATFHFSSNYVRDC
jgi:hypothetical protein